MFIVEMTIGDLVGSRCVAVEEDGMSLIPETFGRIASYYYLQHETMRLFDRDLQENMNIQWLIKVL